MLLEKLFLLPVVSGNFPLFNQPTSMHYNLFFRLLKRPFLRTQYETVNGWERPSILSGGLRDEWGTEAEGQSSFWGSC